MSSSEVLVHRFLLAAVLLWNRGDRIHLGGSYPFPTKKAQNLLQPGGRHWEHKTSGIKTRVSSPCDRPGFISARQWRLWWGSTSLNHAGSWGTVFFIVIAISPILRWHHFQVREIIVIRPFACSWAFPARLFITYLKHGASHRLLQKSRRVCVFNSVKGRLHPCVWFIGHVNGGKSQVFRIDHLFNLTFQFLLSK